MTRADKIRTMTDEEMAILIKGIIDTSYRHLGLWGLRDSAGFWLDWLKEDAVEYIEAYSDTDSIMTRTTSPDFLKGD